MCHVVLRPWNPEGPESIVQAEVSTKTVLWGKSREDKGRRKCGDRCGVSTETQL